VFVLCFGSKKRGLLRKLKGNFAPSIAKNFQVGPQFTSDTRILLRPDVLCAVPSYKGLPRVSEGTVEHVTESFVRRTRKSTRHASREAGIPTLLCGECYENVYI
jgi:hypothetical protein